MESALVQLLVKLVCEVDPQCVIFVTASLRFCSSPRCKTQHLMCYEAKCLKMPILPYLWGFSLRITAMQCFDDICVWKFNFLFSSVNHAYAGFLLENHCTCSIELYSSILETVRRKTKISSFCVCPESTRVSWYPALVLFFRVAVMTEKCLFAVFLFVWSRKISL